MARQDLAPEPLVVGGVLTARLEDPRRRAAGLLGGVAGHARERRVYPLDNAAVIGYEDRIGGRIECGGLEPEKLALVFDVRRGAGGIAPAGDGSTRSCGDRTERSRDHCAAQDGRHDIARGHSDDEGGDACRSNAGKSRQARTSPRSHGTVHATPMWSARVVPTHMLNIIHNGDRPSQKTVGRAG